MSGDPAVMTAPPQRMRTRHISIAVWGHWGARLAGFCLQMLLCSLMALTSPWGSPEDACCVPPRLLTAADSGIRCGANYRAHCAAAIISIN